MWTLRVFARTAQTARICPTGQHTGIRRTVQTIGIRPTGQHTGIRQTVQPIQEIKLNTTNSLVKPCITDNYKRQQKHGDWQQQKFYSTQTPTIPPPTFMSIHEKWACFAGMAACTVLTFYCLEKPADALQKEQADQNKTDQTSILTEHFIKKIAGYYENVLFLSFCKLLQEHPWDKISVPITKIENGLKLQLGPEVNIDIQTENLICHVKQGILHGPFFLNSYHEQIKGNYDNGSFTGTITKTEKVLYKYKCKLIFENGKLIYGERTATNIMCMKINRNDDNLFSVEFHYGGKLRSQYTIDQNNQFIGRFTGFDQYNEKISDVNYSQKEPGKPLSGYKMTDYGTEYYDNGKKTRLKSRYRDIYYDDKEQIDFTKSDQEDSKGRSLKLGTDTITVYKLCRLRDDLESYYDRGNFVLVELEVPKHAERIPFIIGEDTTKVSEAVVKRIISLDGKVEYQCAYSAFYGGTIYKVGQTVYPDSFNLNPDDKHGIHVFKYPDYAPTLIPDPPEYEPWM